jgi:hypothetical protein
MSVGSIAPELVAQFDRIVRRDGGEVVLLSAGGDVLRVGYRPGNAGPDCRDDVCILPQEELRQLMGETLQRRSPGAELVVEVLS